MFGQPNIVDWTDGGKHWHVARLLEGQDPVQDPVEVSVLKTNSVSFALTPHHARSIEYFHSSQEALLLHLGSVLPFKAFVTEQIVVVTGVVT
jgi:hypothetical protein